MELFKHNTSCTDYTGMIILSFHVQYSTLPCTIQYRTMQQSRVQSVPHRYDWKDIVKLETLNRYDMINI